jgi:hypothetical protein
MKRVTKTFAAGDRVYAAGALLPDNHPVAKAKGRAHFFEDAPEPQKPKRGRGKAAAFKGDEQPSTDEEQDGVEGQGGVGQEPDGGGEEKTEGGGDADGDT